MKIVAKKNTPLMNVEDKILYDRMYLKNSRKVKSTIQLWLIFLFAAMSKLTNEEFSFYSSMLVYVAICVPLHIKKLSIIPIRAMVEY
jgi:hypothetical protein